MALIENPPIEKYKIKDKTVFVKRDDLMGDGEEFPPWGKLTGIRSLLKANILDRNKPLIHLSVYGSWSGWALSRLTKEEGYEFIMAYPDVKKMPDYILQIAESNGARLYPLKPNMMRILYNRVGKIARENGWQRLPYAFNNEAYISHMYSRLKSVLSDLSPTYLIVSTGSGVTSVGFIRAFFENEGFFIKDKEFHSVAMASPNSIKKVLVDRHAYNSKVFLYPTEYDFYDRMDWYEAPFPCNDFWDKKSWYWLESNIDRFDGDILFWNLGGNTRW